jgi:hypothetical protein
MSNIIMRFVGPVKEFFLSPPLFMAYAILCPVGSAVISAAFAQQEACGATGDQIEKLLGNIGMLEG